MLAWEIFGADLVWLEVYAGSAFLAALASWVLFRKLPMSLIALAITVALIAVGGFRGFDYNSDTMNYYSYVYMLSFVNDSEIFFLTKLEPLHSGLILLLRDFRLWLLAESGVGAALEHGPVGLYLVVPVEAGISPSQPGIPAPSPALQALRTGFAGMTI